MPVPPDPAVRSAHFRVCTFACFSGWGVWMLAAAVVLFVWSGFKQTWVVNAGDLKTVEGTVVDYKSQQTSQRYPGGGSGRRFRGSTGAINILRIQLPGGAITEFSSHTWVRPPRNGWQRGQPIRVRHDGLRDLYEVVVAGETLQDVASTQRLRSEGEPRAAAAFAALFLLVWLGVHGRSASLSRISAVSAASQPLRASPPRRMTPPTTAKSLKSLGRDRVTSEKENASAAP